MARIELTNGNWAELRDVDKLNAGDRLAVRRVNRVPVGEGAGDSIIGSWQDEMRVALLTKIILSWSYPGWPIPSITPDPETAVLQIPIEDYDVFTVKLKPYMDIVDYYPSMTTSGESDSISEETPTTV